MRLAGWPRDTHSRGQRPWPSSSPPYSQHWAHSCCSIHTDGMKKKKKNRKIDDRNEQRVHRKRVSDISRLKIFNPASK